MNNLLTQTHNILSDIIEYDLPFGLALNKHFKVDKKKVIDQNLKNNVSAILGCALRHAILFDELIKKYFGELPLRVRTSMHVYMANKIFLNMVDEKEAFAFMKQKFIDNQLEFDNDKYCQLDEATNDRKNLIPNELNPESNEYLSCRFNTPIWLIKMWKKQFSPKLTYPILSANSKGASVLYRVNNSIISTSDFLKENPSFQETEIPGMVAYVGEKNLRKATVRSCPNIYEYSQAYKKVFDMLDLDPFRGIAVYTGTVNNAFLELMACNSNNVKFDYVAKNGEAYYHAKKLAERYALENVSIYAAQPSAIITCISRPVHNFIVMPESSNFAQIRVNPDYLIHFKSEEFDSLLAAQKDALEEAGQLIEDGGNLTYMVTTLNHKEGRAQVINFLNNHPEFKMVEDRQIFPFDKLDCTLYYAVLKKKDGQND